MAYLEVGSEALNFSSLPVASWWIRLLAHQCRVRWLCCPGRIQCACCGWVWSDMAPGARCGAQGCCLWQNLGRWSCTFWVQLPKAAQRTQVSLCKASCQTRRTSGATPAWIPPALPHLHHHSTPEWARGLTAAASAASCSLLQLPTLGLAPPPLSHSQGGTQPARGNTQPSKLALGRVPCWRAKPS